MQTTRIIALTLLSTVSLLGCDPETAGLDPREAAVADAAVVLDDVIADASAVEPWSFMPRGQATPALVDLGIPASDPVAVGEKPFHFQKYGPFSSSGQLNTGFPVDSWIPAVVGIRAQDGDINESGPATRSFSIPTQRTGSGA